VAWRAALNGGALAALLFAGAKQGFAHYLTAFPQQEVIYGAFAAVPLFLLWLYLSWLVILFGAEFTQVFGQRMPLAGVRSEEQRV
jgi:membrane protein